MTIVKPALLLTFIVAIGTVFAIASDVGSGAPLVRTANAAAMAAPSSDLAVNGISAAPDASARRANAPFNEQTQAMLTRGAQLSALGDCMVCHTAKNGQPYAGGLPLKTPFGTIYSTNITPDKTTGIGVWSEADFAKAMQHGVSRDGHLLYPAFPYVHFTHISGEDLHALYQFLMRRDPVNATAPANKLIFPLSFRPLMAGWNLFFLRDAGLTPVQVDVNQSAAMPVSVPDAEKAQWQRGQYLVESLGHCAACHTPMNFLGAEQSRHAFAGGSVDGWSAPALTDLANRPIPWTQPQLVAYLRTGLASEHGAAAGPMLPVTQHLADAPETDVEAIAVYMMSLQTGSGTMPQSTPTLTPATASLPSSDNVSTNPQGDPAMQARLQSGAVIFNASCASCHGAGAPMSTQVDRPSLSRSTSLSADDPRNTVRQILEGIPWESRGTTRYMPAFGTLLTDAQIADVADYTRAAYTGKKPWPSLDAAAVAHLRK